MKRDFSEKSQRLEDLKKLWAERGRMAPPEDFSRRVMEAIKAKGGKADMPFASPFAGMVSRLALSSAAALVFLALVALWAGPTWFSDLIPLAVGEDAALLVVSIFLFG